jgi:Fe-S cluster assembly protein SufD
MPTYNCPSWLQAEQEVARHQMVKAGWPQKRDEAWRYSSADIVSKKQFETVLPDQSTFVLPDPILNLSVEADYVLYFYNGHFLQSSSKANFQENVLVAPLGRVLSSAGRVQDLAKFHLLRKPNEKLKALGWQNQAQFEQGSFVHVKVTPEQGLKIMCVYIYGQLQNVDQQKSFAVFPRNVFYFGPQTQVDGIEAHVAVNDLDYYVSSATDVWVEKSAQVKFGQVMWTGGEASFVNDLQVQVASEGQLMATQYIKSSALTRNEVEVHLNAPGAAVQLYTTVEGAEKSVSDSSTFIHHRQGLTKSEQIVKQMADDEASVNFSGRLLIAQDAQKSDAQQLNHNLVLSPAAEANARPQLEVNADDVKAAHGATVGQLQEEEIFYLMSRAIPREQAVALLTQGYKSELISRAPDGWWKSTMLKFITAGGPDDAQ